MQRAHRPTTLAPHPPERKNQAVSVLSDGLSQVGQKLRVISC